MTSPGLALRVKGLVLSMRSTGCTPYTQRFEPTQVRKQNHQGGEWQGLLNGLWGGKGMGEMELRGGWRGPGLGDCLGWGMEERGRECSSRFWLGQLGDGDDI